MITLTTIAAENRANQDTRLTGAPPLPYPKCSPGFSPFPFLQSGANVITKDADMLTVLDVLACDIGVIGVFSDWPAMTTYYANYMLD